MDSLIFFLISLRWQDVIDVLLNSYILFRLYVLFRGTTALRVLIGIGLLLCAQRVAVFLGLVLTSWAIQGITAAVAFIIIVIFRNEIRSVLQARNLRAFFWGLPHREIQTSIETIVESAFELAQKHRGALLVIPGRDDIHNFVHSGIAWDGLVSKEMLHSIFWPDNPVHDGAAVIEGRRITEVGGVLPLSQRTDFPSYYGTRHRAAAGLAGVTDALVIVISEERGSVTIAQDNNVQTIDRKTDLSEALHKHLLTHEGRQDYSRGEKRELIIAAVVSLLLITAVWFGFTRGADTLITLDVPLEYINRSQTTDIVDTSAGIIHLQLSGSETLIKSVQPEQVHVQLDLSKSIAGHNIFTITAEQVNLPPGVFLKKIEPSTVDVLLDTLVEKEIPAQIDWSGKLPENMILVSATLDPENITVTGGGHILDKLSTLYTEKIPVDSIARSGSRTVAVVLNPPSLKITSGSEKVTIRYIVRERGTGQ